MQTFNAYQVYPKLAYSSKTEASKSNPLFVTDLCHTVSVFIQVHTFYGGIHSIGMVNLSYINPSKPQIIIEILDVLAKR